MKTMAFKLVDNVFVVVHTNQTPSEAEWNAYVEAVVAASMQRTDAGILRYLIFTAGGGPNAGQRKASNDALQRVNALRNSAAAVISASPAVRGIVTVFSWFNINIKSFSPAQTEDALHHLEIQPEMKAKALVALRQLKAELDLR
jgi:hypothetical protein